MKRVRMSEDGNYYTFSVLVTGSLVVPFTEVTQFELRLNGDVCDEFGSFIETLETASGDMNIRYSVRGLVRYQNSHGRNHTELEMVIINLKPAIWINGQEFLPVEFETTVGKAMLTQEKPRIVFGSRRASC